MKSSFFLLIILFCMNGYSAELKTNYVTFLISEHTLSLDHQESSSAPGYSSISNKSNIPMFSLRVGVEKEFLADKFMSFTVGVGLGGKYGRVKNELVTKNLQFRDRASGTFYGFGGSINGNFYIYKMRSQVFGGFQVLKSDSLCKLTYSPMAATTPSVNINYEEDSTQSFITGGVRFFDEKLGLMSIIAVDYKVASTYNTRISKAKIDNTDIDLSNNAQVTHSPFGFSLGFGLMF